MTNQTILTDEIRDKLIAAACEVGGQAYAPYSHYPVGSALLTDDDRIFTGVNVENASYGMTICAERNAVAAMVTAGGRHVRAIA
ncbi:MAG TPA: cytidine deaminase, partial [Promineifilum sp.]|nr:cytidine deaminase [Promineifilum sp.]